MVRHIKNIDSDFKYVLRYLFNFRKDDIQVKIKHSDHMIELWEKISPYYHQVKSNPPTNAKELCACYNKNLRKDVLEMLDLAADYLRTSGIMGTVLMIQ